MAIKFSDRYPISADKLYELLTQMRFFEQRYQDTGVEEYTVKQYAQRTDGFDIAIDLLAPIEVPNAVPKAARKMVPAVQEMQFSMIWHQQPNGWLAEYCYNVVGRPIKVLGTRLIENSDDDTCISNMDFHVECSIPMFGKILAEVLEKRIRLELESDERALNAFIAAESA